MSNSSSIASQIAIGLVLSLTSIGVGYQLGTLASSSSSCETTQTEPASEPEQDTLLENLHEEDSEDIPDGDLAAISAGWTEPCKMVLVVRTDLKMSSGTIASQCADATLACYKALSKKNLKLVQHWEQTGQAKIALKGKSEDQILELQAIAKSLNLCARAAKNLELGEDTRTVLAIGPAPVNLINEVTGKLRLL